MTTAAAPMSIIFDTLTTSCDDDTFLLHKENPSCVSADDNEAASALRMTTLPLTSSSRAMDKGGNAMNEGVEDGVDDDDDDALVCPLSACLVCFSTSAADSVTSLRIDCRAPSYSAAWYTSDGDGKGRLSFLSLACLSLPLDSMVAKADEEDSSTPFGAASTPGGMNDDDDEEESVVSVKDGGRPAVALAALSAVMKAPTHALATEDMIL